MRRLHLITGNLGKLREFKAALEPSGYEVVHLPEEVEEIQADTLEEVVADCLRQLHSRGLKDFVLDDSGLFIDTLKGFPGVYSSYALRTLGCQGVLRLLEGAQDRRARFECCIGCSLEGMGDIILKESCKGRIVHAMRGEGGFGFDPIFAAAGEGRTFAEMPLEEKNVISHRGKAIKS
ncbi:MAG: RdgB/HAM1 family non-canonical purine NTP pyrophosphatase, partial [Methanomassiliicoccales archaeon]|nr:RdgB/HAM1 family non-canonical purine NTP pyrophosphatase [Methanomassiliicoccales archaeon]